MCVLTFSLDSCESDSVELGRNLSAGAREDENREREDECGKSVSKTDCRQLPTIPPPTYQGNEASRDANKLQFSVRPCALSSAKVRLRSLARDLRTKTDTQSQRNKNRMTSEEDALLMGNTDRDTDQPEDESLHGSSAEVWKDGSRTPLSPHQNAKLSRSACKTKKTSPTSEVSQPCTIPGKIPPAPPPPPPLTTGDKNIPPPPPLPPPPSLPLAQGQSIPSHITNDPVMNKLDTLIEVVMKTLSIVQSGGGGGGGPIMSVRPVDPDIDLTLRSAPPNPTNSAEEKVADARQLMMAELREILNSRKVE